MSDKKKDLSELNDYDEELNLDGSDEEVESEEEYEEEYEEKDNSEKEYEENTESEDESDSEAEEEYEEEAEAEEEYEEEAEKEYEEEVEAEEEYEEGAEEEYEETDDEPKKKSSRKLIYGLGAITVLAGGYFGYQQLSAPSYNNVQPVKPVDNQSSNTGDSASDTNIINDSEGMGVENNNNTIPNNSTNQDPIIEEPVDEPMNIVGEPEQNMVTISEDDYNNLIERIENLEELVSEREDVIVDFEDRFNVLDELIETVESTNQRIDKVEKDINSIQESFAIIDEMKKSQEKLSNKIEIQDEELVEEVSDTSDSVSEKTEDKDEMNVSSKKEEKPENKEVDKKEKETVKKTNTSNEPKFIPESERKVISGWKGVATMNGGNKVAIDLGDGRFITLVENEPVKVYGRVQRIADDGTVYFRTHKINFMN